MPLWRCPHCNTPQPESARCWLCGRSTTSCAACRHYRRGVAGGLGLCGQRPRKVALRGTEVLPCWEGPASHETASPTPDSVGASVRGRDGGSLRGRDERPTRTFVPVDDLRVASAGTAGAPTGATAGAGPSSAGPGTARWSLWGDPDS